MIPADREEHPRIVDLLRDDEALGCLRRVHDAFGEALREAQMSRDLDFVDPRVMIFGAGAGPILIRH